MKKVVICQHKKGFVGISGNKKATAKPPKKRGIERFLEAYPYQKYGYSQNDAKLSVLGAVFGAGEYHLFVLLRCGELTGVAFFEVADRRMPIVNFLQIGVSLCQITLDRIQSGMT